MARLHDIKVIDLENTYWGVSTSLWFNHCPHRCFNCWNEETWGLDTSLEMDNDLIINETLLALDLFGLRKDLTLLGGEPFSPSNITDLIYIIQNIKQKRPQTKILAWSGFEFYIMKRNRMIKKALPFIDILVCGRYIDQWNCSGAGKMYGSENQYIVDVSHSLKCGKTVYIEKGLKFQNLEAKFEQMTLKRMKKSD